MATYYVYTKYSSGKGYTWFTGTLEECQAYYLRETLNKSAKEEKQGEIRTISP